MRPTAMSTHPVRSWGEPIQAAPTGARGEPPQRPLDRIVARRARWIGGLVIAWALSRVGYFAAGVRFDGRMLDGADQIVDRELLRTDYWRTLWYLHSQPPLFNAFVGAVEHLPKAARPAAYWLSSCSATVATGIGAAYLARSARISPKAAWVIVVLLVVRPDAVLYEQWFFYTNFEAALLVVALAGMRGWASSSDKVARLRWAIPASGGLTALVLMRSLFHVLFVVFVMGVVTLAGKLTIRQCIQIALLPVVLGTLLYVKNYVYFDSFGPSTWQGENLARITLGRLSSAERDQLITEGVVSVNAAIIPFTPNYVPPPGRNPRISGPKQTLRFSIRGSSRLSVRRTSTGGGTSRYSERIFGTPSCSSVKSRADGSRRWGCPGSGFSILQATTSAWSRILGGSIRSAERWTWGVDRSTPVVQN